MKNLHKARSYVNSEILHHVENHTASDKVIIVTPEVLTAIKHELTYYTGDVLFIGFDRSSPLNLHDPIVINGNVWIYESIIYAIDALEVTGELTLLQSIVPETKIVLSSPNPIIMDEATFDDLREAKKKNRRLGNFGIRLLTDSEEIDGLLKSIAFNSVKIDIVNYVIATHEDLLLERTEDGNMITGNSLNLIGPFIYDLSDIDIINTELNIHDEFNQTLEGVKIKGMPNILGYY